MRRAVRTFSGTKDSAVTKRELENRAVARKAAAEGIVLMKNDGVLPLKKGSRVALLGSGAGRTVKGGTGSGDVNEREVVSIFQGMENAGFQITSRRWIRDYEEVYRKSREDWRDAIFAEAKGKPAVEFFQIYASHAYEMPAGAPVTREDCEGTDTAVYVISRIAGEAADRFARRGDYYLTEKEKEDLENVCRFCEKVIVVLNVGGQMDLKEILEYSGVKALLYVAQPGMEGGNALADVLSGDVTPSGKLTDTWAAAYEDFPNSGTFSHNNGNVNTEKYEEGIYVGYRYFDSFQVEPVYPFGYGLTYTEFEISCGRVSSDGASVTAAVQVKNTGATYAGKEVVQIYASCPQKGMAKEYRRLCAFAKTSLLMPGQQEELELTFPVRALASFDQEAGQWVTEPGLYGIWVGNSSRNLTLAGALSVKKRAVLEQVSSICPLREELTELKRPEKEALLWEESWHGLLKEKGIRSVEIEPQAEKAARIPENELDRQARAIADRLTDEELTAMVIGEISKGQENALGSAGIMVPGAAGETSQALEEKYDVPGIAMADGPAGLRLSREYQVDPQARSVYGQGLLGALEGGFFADREVHEDAETYYQYCTAIPVGTLLAQSWDVELLEETGRAVAREMREFGVAWWLAPGMNIHRNPLCGRNFEYYSEDPVVSGMMAAAITRGVQSVGGVGTTIKHFACNNQEDNRMGSDSVVSQRALREIYLKGFEIAVKTSQPMAIMTSYNKINGVHAANCRDICTVAARQEWDFQGIIMTDWTTTQGGGSISWKCPEAGNDLIMPGWNGDIESIRQALADGSLKREDLKACVKRMLKVIFQTLGYEDSVSYGAQFENMKPYVTVERRGNK